MNDSRKTKAQLIEELRSLRERATEMERRQDRPQRGERVLWESQELAEHKRLDRERAALLQKIEQSKREWEATFDALTDCVLLVDRERKVVRCNRATAEFLGLTWKEILGRTCHDLFFHGQVPPAGNPFQDMLRSGKRESHEFLLPDVQRWVNVTVDPMRDGDGQVTGAVETVRDITERKQVEAELRESEKKYRTLFEDSLEAILLTREGKIVDVNPAWLQLHGFEDKDEVIGMDIIDFIHPEDQKIFLERRKMLPTERERVCQVREVRKDGGVIDVEVYSTGIVFDGEEAILVTVHDITERKRLHQEVTHSAKMAALGTMVSGIAHEINNPLAAISGYAFLLSDDENVPAAVREDMRHVLSQVERCSHIVDSLLRFARRHGEEREWTDVNEVMLNTVDLRRHDMQVSSIEIVEEYDGDVPKTLANAWHLQQVFLDIINNAYDAIADRNGPGRIVVGTRGRGDRIAIKIEDNGGGMKDPSRVFEPFYTTKEVGKGTGLGLSVAYGIIQNHGGKILAENTDEGARFTIYLPVVTRDPGVKRKPQIEYKAGPVAPKRVLILDDEEDVAEVARRTLARHGHVVETCHDAGTALQKLQATEFDVVIMDVLMPGEVAPRDVYDWIRENRPAFTSRVIFITGSPTGRRTGGFLERIDNPVLRKPFDLDDLCRVVDSVSHEA